MINLTTNKVIDKHLKPIKSGEDNTSLELASEDNGAKVKGDLEVTGYTDNITLREEAVVKAVDNVTLDSEGEITLDAKGDITLDADGGDIRIEDGGVRFADIYTGGSASLLRLYENEGASTDDYFSISVAAEGATTISTIDGSGTDANLIITADGDITLNSLTGVFKTFNGLVEFSPTNSAYSGMLLGATHVFGSGTGGQFVQISTAWENLLWDTDKFALVTFVVPPSNRVKISVHLPYVGASSYAVQLGLATDSSATTLGTKYQNDVDDANRSDSFNINYSWVVEGSDHSWSAGETKTIYIMAYTASNVRFYSGGTNTSGFGGVIVEATALPATIGDGSEP